MKMLEVIRNTILDFCRNFVLHPYLCYTEHGQHALFYSRLFTAIPEENRYISYRNQKVCVIQKEYPTAGKLGKPQRQHWDIAVIKSPIEDSPGAFRQYDYFRLLTVIEFGMNESKEHLLDDIERLCHQEANLEHGFIVHLYRLSECGNLFSGRDWSSNSPKIMTTEDIRILSIGKPVEIYLGLTDSTGKHASNVWKIRNGLVKEMGMENANF